MYRNAIKAGYRPADRTLTAEEVRDLGGTPTTRELAREAYENDYYRIRINRRLQGVSAPLPDALQNSDVDYSEQPAKKE